MQRYGVLVNEMYQNMREAFASISARDVNRAAFRATETVKGHRSVVRKRKREVRAGTRTEDYWQQYIQVTRNNKLNMIEAQMTKLRKIVTDTFTVYIQFLLMEKLARENHVQIRKKLMIGDHEHAAVDVMNEINLL